MVEVDRETRARLVAAGALAALTVGLSQVFVRWGRHLFPAYRTMSRALMGLLANVASVAPFALWDIAALVLVLGALVSLVRRIRQRRPLLPLLSTVLLVASVTLFLFVGGWALNHYAPPLSEEISLEVDEYTTEELAEATSFYLREASRLAPQVPRDEDGRLARQDFFELARIAGASYGPLSEEHAIFEGPAVPVKALLLAGEPLLYSGHTGIFWAATGESCVPLNCAHADMPFIMCHEAAHRLGLASEQEANFAAFLACTASDDVRLAYAGYYNAYCYCSNALYRHDPARYEGLVTDLAGTELRDGLVLVLNDRVATSEHYDAYEGPFEKVGTKVNDSYLKSFGESEGVRSYGLVVDYLIAWHQQGL